MFRQKSHRRDVLKLLGIGAGHSLLRSPLLLLADTLLRDRFSQALGQGASDYKWVDIMQSYAPPRWVFDLMLKPYAGGPALVPNAQVGTRYVASGGRYTNVTYDTVNRGGIEVPYIWQFPVPKADGGTRPMIKLLDNFLSIRGINTENPGHQGSQRLHYLPLGLTQSIPALAGDVSAAPLGGIYAPANGQYVYRSTVGKSPVVVAGDNLIKSLLTPFTSGSSGAFKEGKEALQTHIAATKSAFATESASGYASAAILQDAVRGADDLILRSFGDIAQVWSGLLEKYSDLIRRSLDPAVELIGINDHPIGIAGTRSEEYSFGRDTLAGNADLRTMITTATVIQDLAESFAVAEFVLLNNLSSSVTLALGEMDNLSVTGGPSTSNFDEHYIGKMPTLFINSYYARAYASCLLEFIDMLKQARIFEKTVICCGGEFNRGPRSDGFGSDHGSYGQSLAFYSGSIEGPHVIGNIAADTPRSPGHRGTWGFTAPTAGMNLVLGHVAASIATMLRVPSPTRAFPTLLQINAGKIVPLPSIPRGTLVAG